VSVIAYRPHALVTVDARIRDWRKSLKQFEGETLCFTTGIGSKEELSALDLFLSHEEGLTLASFARLWKAQAREQEHRQSLSFLFITRDGPLHEHCWIFQRSVDRAPYTGEITSTGPTSYQRWTIAGQGPEMITMPMVKNQPMQVVTHVFLTHLLKGDGSAKLDRPIRMPSPHGIVTLPREDLAFEMDLLTKLAVLDD
jgi:hypothetical protein